MRMTLSLKTLANFDFGKADVAFQQAMTQAVKDLLDRPGDKTARVVKLEVHLTPLQEQDGDLTDANVEFKITNKVPAWKTAPKPTVITRQGQLVFSEMAPDNPRQLGIGEAADIVDDAQKRLDAEED